MKLLGKLLFGFLVILIGLNLYSCSSGYAFNKFIADEGDKAIKEDDLSFFKGLFENYKDPWVEQAIAVEDEFSFNFHVFLEANEHKTYLVFLVDDLTIEKQASTLDIKIETSDDEIKQQLIRVGKENWYLQWFEFKNVDVYSVLITHPAPSKDADPVVLYEHKKTDGLFIDVNELNFSSLVKGENVLGAVVKKLLELPLDNTDAEPEFSGKTYNVKVEVVTHLELGENEKLYLVGNFNNWETNDTSYELKRVKDTSLFEADFNISTKYETLWYTIKTQDGKLLVDEDDSIIYLSKKLIDVDNFELSDYGITTVSPYKFGKYRYITWISIAVYLVLVALASYFFFFRKKRAGKAVYQRPTQPRKEQPKAQTKSTQNLNLKAIEKTEQRDAVYNKEEGIPSKKEK